MHTILELQGICKQFGRIKALNGVDLAVAGGEIHALLGENGAGKSTLMKILGGVHRPDQGRIIVGGEERHFTSYHDAIKSGVAIIFQEFSLIPYLNAVDNMFLGREMRNTFGLLSRTMMRRRAEAIFRRLGVTIDLSMEVRRLSLAQQQFVEIGKALSLEARILILDEPTATLTPAEAAHLFTVMRELKRLGVAMIFISHHMEEIFEVCDRVTVLRDGAYVGSAEVVATTVDDLVEMMVGRRLQNTFPPKTAARMSTSMRTAMDVRAIQLRRDGPVNRFQLREGEILGFAGLVGSGRTELALGLIGADPCHRKDVSVHGVTMALHDPAEALVAGVGLLPENRKTEGLILDFSIKDNISLNNLQKYCSALPFIRRGAEREDAQCMSRDIDIKAPDVFARVGNLSGGNQQKVVIARWLNHHCKILIFDEPTRGIDVGAKAEIYRLMRRLTVQGYAVIMISSELPEIVGMCDRVAVFRQGAIVTILEGDSIQSNEVMRHATTGSRLEFV
ncbi:ribonucleotide-diphosphate reductase subunit alpha [Herbaspirillum hiltneri N3]|uniref:Ribonucleotide-diphosphate reductase subunit alpha n=1 Tax=Herbaspirillum hiltneri N3 TaxID=1262470 RepID=A0ABM5V6N4_9BURK|nr:sugar ABC transporter ATP-binding protein [Herbaspirillum hiltneri]AKZ65036.1 ribonucleotide-diphosphate reductase subunit alpha [Herbaspirillum hiltneri N3]